MLITNFGNLNHEEALIRFNQLVYGSEAEKLKCLQECQCLRDVIISYCYYKGVALTDDDKVKMNYNTFYDMCSSKTGKKYWYDNTTLRAILSSYPTCKAYYQSIKAGFSDATATITKSGSGSASGNRYYNSGSGQWSTTLSFAYDSDYGTDFVAFAYTASERCVTATYTITATSQNYGCAAWGPTMALSADGVTFRSVTGSYTYGTTSTASGTYTGHPASMSMSNSYPSSPYTKGSGSYDITFTNLTISE